VLMNIEPGALCIDDFHLCLLPMPAGDLSAQDSRKRAPGSTTTMATIWGARRSPGSNWLTGTGHHLRIDAAHITFPAPVGRLRRWELATWLIRASGSVPALGLLAWNGVLCRPEPDS
jgi:hypothetical protein